MKEIEKLELIETSWELHGQVEASYLNHKASRGDDKWLEKQRFLLADMALVNLERLRDNIHAILTISDDFLPKARLKEATAKLYED